MRFLIFHLRHHTKALVYIRVWSGKYLSLALCLDFKTSVHNYYVMFYRTMQTMSFLGYR